MKEWLKEMFERLKAIDNGTIVRTITLILAAANQVVATIGASSFASAAWYQIATVCVTIMTAAWTAWENNDYTHLAAVSTRVLDALEDGKITEEDVKKLLEK